MWRSIVVGLRCGKRPRPISACPCRRNPVAGERTARSTYRCSSTWRNYPLPGRQRTILLSFAYCVSISHPLNQTTVITLPLRWSISPLIRCGVASPRHCYLLDTLPTTPPTACSPSETQVAVVQHRYNLYKTIYPPTSHIHLISFKATLWSSSHDDTFILPVCHKNIPLGIRPDAPYEEYKYSTNIIKDKG